MLARFYDPENGGFWQSAADAKDLILRVKEDYDGAEPSGNSVAILALLKLAADHRPQGFHAGRRTTLRLFAHRLQHVPQAVPFMLQALDFSLGRTVARRHCRRSRLAKRARTLARSSLGLSAQQSRARQPGPVEPFAKTLPEMQGPVVYLCTGDACQPPTRDAAQLRKMLK